MSFSVICDGCGTSCAAAAELVGERVECPACGHCFVVPTPEVSAAAIVELITAQPDFGVYRPAPADAYRVRPSLSTALFGWADGCQLGRGPAAALTAATLLCVFGIVSPLPLRAAMLALPVWALGYVAWCHLSAEQGRRRRRRRVDPGTLLARAALIAATGGATAVWGAMIYGRAVFDFGSGPGQPIVPIATAEPIGPPAAGPTVPDVTVARPAVAVAPPPAVNPAPPAEPVATAVAVSSAVQPASVELDPVINRASAPTVAPDPDAARDRAERVSQSNLRVLRNVLAEYAARSGRFPRSLDALTQRAAIVAALHSPFESVDRSAGYVFPAAGRRVAPAADPAILYDAAELADRGVTVGITATGRLLYLDAEQVSDLHAEWQRDR